jgi:hypothetical protein
VPGRRSITGAEKLTRAGPGGIRVRREQMAAVAGICRAASAVRARTENRIMFEEPTPRPAGIRLAEDVPRVRSHPSTASSGSRWRSRSPDTRPAPGRAVSRPGAHAC